MTKWWRNYQKRKNCFHHEVDLRTRECKSFITDALIDLGRRKLFHCSECGKTWVF